ncbi:MAG TPA: hypothetical protein VGN34_25050 [Ktedonobacteraceae bacterium]
MKTQTPEIKENVAKEELPAPGGIGMAVAVDWGLAVQVVLTLIITIVGTTLGQSEMTKIPVLSFPLSSILFFIVALFFACVLIWFGEMVRSGHYWARMIQIVFSVLLTLLGLSRLVGFYHSVTTGNFWPLVTAIILLIISPLTVWRMIGSSTGRWFKFVTFAEARKRHGGKWVWCIVLCSIIGGILQTIASIR